MRRIERADGATEQFAICAERAATRECLARFHDCRAAIIFNDVSQHERSAGLFSGVSRRAICNSPSSGLFFLAVRARLTSTSGGDTNRSQGRIGVNVRVKREKEGTAFPRHPFPDRALRHGRRIAYLQRLLTRLKKKTNSETC